MKLGAGGGGGVRPVLETVALDGKYDNIEQWRKKTKKQKNNISKIKSKKKYFFKNFPKKWMIKLKDEVSSELWSEH
jgi:hypothetical protein